MTLLETIVRTAVPVEDDTFERGLVIDKSEFGFVCRLVGPHARATEEHDNLESVIENTMNRIIAQLGWKCHAVSGSTITSQLVEVDTGRITATGFPITRETDEVKALDAIRRTPNTYDDRVFTILPLKNGWRATHRHMDDLSMVDDVEADTMSRAILKAVNARF